jgi:hypothetical protein
VVISDNAINLGKYEGSFQQFGSLTWNEVASLYFDFMSDPVFASKNNGPDFSAGSHNAIRNVAAVGGNNDSGGIQPWGRLDEYIIFERALNNSPNANLRRLLYENQRNFYGIT